VSRSVLALAVALALGCGGHARPEVVKAPSAPGSIVVADGHKVYFDCEGTGSPTVVFLDGWGADSLSWISVSERVARVTRACTYDRFGIGFTAQYQLLPNRPRDARDQVRELEQLLRNARIDAPYVLVGHSWGGTLARLYAGTHYDVKAVVLVDSSSPGQDAALKAALPPERADESQLFAEIRRGSGNALSSPEHLAWQKSLNEARTVTSLGDRPLIVVTARNDFVGVERLYRVWLGLQNRLASLSSRSVHVLAPLSGHFVQTDQPDLVTAAIRAAIGAARNGGRLPPCAAIFRRVQYRTCLPRVGP
jgi:pimeloyl-ACP methyl ester carboxylesterase